MKIGKNVIIGKVNFRHLDKIEIGDNVIIDDFCYFSASVKIGSNVHIGPFCSVTGGASSEFIMEDFSGLSSGCRVICSSDDFINDLTNPTVPSAYRPHCTPGKVVLERHAVLGINTLVMPNVTIHEGAASGAGALIRQDLEAWSINYGSPSQQHGFRNKEAILQLEKAYLEELK